MTGSHNPFYDPEPGIARLFIFGAGGFAREVAWLAEQSWQHEVELHFLVDDAEYLSDPVNDVPVQLLDDVVADDNDRFVIAVADAGLRRRAAAACVAKGLRPATIVHPRVEASARNEIGEGSIICAGTILTTNIKVGQHVQINLDCTVGHDAILGDYSTLAPGVHVSGNVHIGCDVHVGTGANIIDGSAANPLVIGDGAVIAAGACVTKPVEAGAMVAGVPAVRKR